MAIIKQNVFLLHLVFYQIVTVILQTKQYHSQRYLSGGAKWKILPGFRLLFMFQIFLFFHDFILFPCLFPEFWIFFSLSSWHSAPLLPSPTGYATAVYSTSSSTPLVQPAL